MTKPVDWDRVILDILRNHGAGTGAAVVPWQAVVTYWQGLSAAEAALLAGHLVTMIDLNYRNPHSDEPYSGDGFTLLPLPAGMKPDDLLVLEAAAYAATELRLAGVKSRLQALLREPRFHAVYPHLRRLHLDITDLLRAAAP